MYGPGLFFTSRFMTKFFFLFPYTHVIITVNYLFIREEAICLRNCIL